MRHKSAGRLIERPVTHHVRYPVPRDHAAWEAFNTDPRSPPRLCDGRRQGAYTASGAEAATCPACEAKRQAREAHTAALAKALNASALKGLLHVYDAGTGQGMYVEAVVVNGGIQITLAPDPEVFSSDASPPPSHVRRRMGR